MAARSVRCRGAAARPPVVSSPKRSATRIRICSTDSARTRAAASSMASGMPSSDWHTPATAAALPVVSVKPGALAAARSANSRTASPADPSAVLTAIGGTCQTVSPATRSGSRLVASSRSSAEAVSSRWHSQAHSSSRCSQLSSTRTSDRERRASPSVSMSGRFFSSVTPTTVATRETTRSGLETSDSSAYRAPSGNSAATLASTRSASRVLPMPPGPVSVTIRPSNTSLRTSTSSCSRPTKLLSSAGSPGAAVVPRFIGAPIVALAGTSQRGWDADAYAVTHFG